jgi:hypothetical protein
MIFRNDIQSHFQYQDSTILEIFLRPKGEKVASKELIASDKFG